MCYHVVLVGTDVSEEHITPILKVKIINKLKQVSQFLKEPHGDTSQKTTFFIVTAVKTSNLHNMRVILEVMSNIFFAK
jgi:hypothetical protein